MRQAATLMLDIIALIPHRAVQARLHDAVRLATARGCIIRLTLTASWPDLHARAATHAPALAIVFVESADAEFRDRYAAFRAAFESIALLPYVTVNPRHIADVAALVQIGVPGLLLHDVNDDRHSLAQHLEAAMFSTVAHRIETAVVPGMRPAVRDIVKELLRSAFGSPSAVQAAHRCSVHSATLRRMCCRNGLPPPARLIGWFRLLYAAAFLGDRGRTVAGVARLLKFPSAAAMSNQFQRYIRVAPTRVPADKLFARVLACYWLQEQDAAARRAGMGSV